MQNPEQQQKKNRLTLIVGGSTLSATAATGTVFAFEQPSNAQAASSAITQMNTDASSIATLSGVLQPIAVGAIVFGAAALLFKRYLYS